VGTNRWQGASTERGKPRIYVQQFLDLRLPEADYKQIAGDLGLSRPFEEEAATQVMEAYLEDVADGSQCDTVHVQRAEGIVALMTVVSFPYRQETYDRLMAEHMTKKALGST